MARYSNEPEQLDDCGHCTLLPTVTGWVRAVQVSCSRHREHPSARRLRTEAERHTDGTTWRPSLGVNPDDPELACTAWRYPDPPPIPDHYPPDAVDLPAPRRRWWHRYTRRPR